MPALSWDSALKGNLSFSINAIARTFCASGEILRNIAMNILVIQRCKNRITGIIYMTSYFFYFCPRFQNDTGSEVWGFCVFYRQDAGIKGEIRPILILCRNLKVILRREFGIEKDETEITKIITDLYDNED